MIATQLLTGRATVQQAVREVQRRGKLVDLTHQAVQQSRRLGHRPGVPSPDEVSGASINACTECGRWICVDLDESDQPYGAGVTEPCKRRGERR